MKETKYKAFVVVQKLDNLGSNMHLAGISEYEVMIDVCSISFDKGKIDYVNDSEGNEYSFLDNSLIAIREYTGLNDKNGKALYDGDIIKFKTRNGYEYIGNKGVINWSYMSYVVSTNVGDYLFLYVDEFEIIGNIYEDSELLNVN